MASAAAVSEFSKIENKLVPLDFGEEGGTEISNKKTILAEVDRACGVSGPPALEYLFFLPWSSIRLPFLFYGFGFNFFGHAALRYTLPTGEQKVVNVVNSKDTFLFWSTPEQYLFGTLWDHCCEQKGVYNRDVIGFRVEYLPPEKIIEMDRYFTEVAARSQEKKAQYHLVLDPIMEYFNKFIPFDIPDYGNCARWVSRGLLQADVVTRSSMLPMAIWRDMVNNALSTSIKSSSNINVICYRRIKHAKLTYGVDASSFAELFFDPDRLADFIVEVPEGTITALVRNNKQRKKKQRSLDRFVITALLAFICYGWRWLTPRRQII